MPLKTPKQLLDKLKNRNKDRAGGTSRGKKSPDRASDAFYGNMGKSSKPSTWQLPPQ